MKTLEVVLGISVHRTEEDPSPPPPTANQRQKPEKPKEPKEDNTSQEKKDVWTFFCT
jgi:hypothetical protein